jgi:DNA (cytosine-5)-methyltransferase 1
MNYVDLFSGLGAFSHALSSLGHQCAAALDNNELMMSVYKTNFPLHQNLICGDIRETCHLVPPHDILCAGFPCQPFSKSGRQRGLADQERGNLLQAVISVADSRKPEYILLENVGNLSEHNHGTTWLYIKEEFEALGYQVRWTRHIKKGGRGMLNPLDFGFPQNRERFFAVCRRGFLPGDVFPKQNCRHTNINSIIISNDELTSEESASAQLTGREFACIEFWQAIIDSLPNKAFDLPHFPLWLEEIDSDYPFLFTTPYGELHRQETASMRLPCHESIENFPPYAQTKQFLFPRWKRRFIQQNREWFETYKHKFPKYAVDGLRDLPHTYRKLEWNDKGGSDQLWDHCLQFRPSGLRISNSEYVPAIVSINKQQLPIYGPIQRRLVFREVKRCFGYPDEFALPKQSTAAVSALGNTIHTEMLKIVIDHILSIPDLVVTPDRITSLCTPGKGACNG